MTAEHSSTAKRLLFLSSPWFDLVGEVACRLVATAKPAGRQKFIERFIGAPAEAAPPGREPGYTLLIENGRGHFEHGVLPGDTADFEIDISHNAAKQATKMLTGAELDALISKFAEQGEFNVRGDPSNLGLDINAMHDEVVARTRFE